MAAAMPCTSRLGTMLVNSEPGPSVMTSASAMAVSAAGRGLKGHSFGNLFLMALTQILGDFPAAVKASSEVLKIAGRIYPSTTANVSLEATLSNGAIIVGETRISRSQHRIQSVRLRPRKVSPLPAALTAIAEADLITLGPGSLFTSIVPNLLVHGIAAAIRS